MNNKKKLEQLIRRTGANIPNIRSALALINKWSNPAPSGFDPFTFLPKTLEERRIVDALSAECHKAADIVSKWDQSKYSRERIERLFSFPELCSKQIARLYRMRDSGFIKTCVFRPYRKHLNSGMLTPMDAFAAEPVSRHLKNELDHPGTFKSVDSPYARCIEKLADFIRSNSTPGDDGDDDDDDQRPLIDL